MSSTTPALSEQLIGRFKSMFASNGPPPWAWPVEPSIPLIGGNYQPKASLLIYASAENLTWLHDEPKPNRFTDPIVWKRYRGAYDEDGIASAAFYPELGIAPASNGGLLAAGLFVSQRLDMPAPAEPRGLVEEIALTNWGKFTVQSIVNEDYAGKLDKLMASLPYVVAELSLLRPKAALVPRTFWSNPALQAAMVGASPETRFLPVYQCNAQVVNTHLVDLEEAGRQLQNACAGNPLCAWMEKVRGITPHHAWRYIASIAETLDATTRGQDNTPILTGGKGN